MYAKASASQRLAHNSAASQYLDVLAVKMGALLKKSRLVTFLSGWGTGRGVWGCEVELGGSSPKIGHAFPKNKFLPPALWLLFPQKHDQTHNSPTPAPSHPFFELYHQNISSTFVARNACFVSGKSLTTHLILTLAVLATDSLSPIIHHQGMS